MFIYRDKDNEIMAMSEDCYDFSHMGWKCEETDEEYIQINGKIVKGGEDDSIK